MKIRISYFFIIIVFLFGNTGCITNPSTSNADKPYLIILSLDGFRWDYPDLANTPTLDSLEKVGTKAQSLVPCFPTKTFPNHYSIATGLYPDNHGIVLNGFHATDLGKKYAIRDRSAVTNGEFYGGEPIWNVAQNNGIPAATLFWVGASAKINNQRPAYWSTYVDGLPFDSRIDSIYTWLTLPDEKRPHLIMWYYKEPDGVGHDFGPESNEVVTEVEKLDSFLNDFFTKVRSLPNYSDLNFIVTSDHGMASLTSDKEIYLTTIIDTADIEFYDGGNPVINIKAKGGQVKKVYNELKKGSVNIDVWEHGNVPEKLHYGNNIRTHDITVVAKPGWSLFFDKKSYGNKGTHGYTNEFKDMHAIFYAAGPAFKTNYIHPAFNNIDIFPLVGEVLNIEVPECDGNKENIIGILTKN